MRSLKLGQATRTRRALAPCAVLVACFLSLTASPAARAALVLLPGYSFDVVYDDQQAGLADFGTPVVTGNTVLFLPTGLLASSTNGTGSDTKEATITFDVVAKPALAFYQVTAVGRGDYRLVGDGSTASVVNELEVVAPPGDLGPAFVSFSPAVPLTNGDGALHAWEASASLVAGEGSPLGTAPTLLSVSLTSVLFASTSSSPSFAFVQQKFAAAAIDLRLRPSNEVTPVPEPGTAGLVGLGLAMLGMLVRQRKVHAGVRNGHVTRSL